MAVASMIDFAGQCLQVDTSSQSTLRSAMPATINNTFVIGQTCFGRGYNNKISGTVDAFSGNKVGIWHK